MASIGVRELGIKIIFEFVHDRVGISGVAKDSPHQIIIPAMVVTIETHILRSTRVSTSGSQSRAVGFCTRTGEAHQLSRRNMIDDFLGSPNLQVAHVGGE